MNEHTLEQEWIKAGAHQSFVTYLVQRVTLAEEQRDCAWQELRDIRKAIGADENESTFDEVVRLSKRA